MSGKAGSIGSLVVGAVLVVVGIATSAYGGGSLIGPGIALMAGGAIGLAFSPKAISQASTRPQDLAVATAADGVPLPVVFGEQRVVGNFMNYTRDQFRSQRVTGRGDGSKGGDATPANVIGFDYFLTFEYGLCMGKIDEIVQVLSVPGERKMMGDAPPPVVYGALDVFKEIQLDSLDPTAAAGSESGVVRVYKGTPTQVRIAAADPYDYREDRKSGPIRKGYFYQIGGHLSVNFTTFGAANNTVGTQFVATSTSTNILTVNDWLVEFTGLNYRFIAWAEFLDFRIGRFPQPKSYHFVIRRFPAHDSNYVMLRPDGTAITGFSVRGSADNTKPAYNQANPAAVMYECLTDKVWGRALPQDMFDESSWIGAATFFESRHIGMSFTLDSADRLFTVLDGIRLQFKMILTWDGQSLKVRCLLDLTTTHAHIQILSKADIRGLRVVRPLWAATVNEIRVEFQNRSKNWRPDSVHVRDHANFQVTGRINSAVANLQGITDFNTARRQGLRILRERAYPLETLEWEMNRFHSQIEVGDVVGVRWDEWDQESTVYVLVGKIEDSDSETDSIKVSAVEDVALTPTVGDEATPTPPTVYPWEKVPDIPESDVQLWSGELPAAPTDKPAVVIEVPAILKNLSYPGFSGLVIGIGQLPAAHYSEIAWYFAKEPGSTFKLSRFFTANAAFGISGTLSTAIEFQYFDRSTTGFQFTLLDPTQDEAALLAMFTACDGPGDDLETVITNVGPIMVCDEEFFQIGKIDRLSVNSYRARNIVRGRWGSTPRRKASGKSMFFVAALPDPVAISTDLTANTKYKWKAIATVGGASTPLQYENGVDFFIHHESLLPSGVSEDHTYLMQSEDPLPPSFYDIADGPNMTVTFPPGAAVSVDTWLIRVRPRFTNFGAETSGLQATIYQPTVAPLPLAFTVTARDPAGNVLTFSAAQIVVTFDPGTDGDPASGLVTLKVPKVYPNGRTASSYQIQSVLAAAQARVSVDDLVVNVI